jgi:hypothetical protein
LTLNVRVELTNVFNRTFMNNPTSTNPAAPQTRVGGSTADNAQTTAGFGFIPNATVFAASRSGQVVARIQF